MKLCTTLAIGAALGAAAHAHAQLSITWATINGGGTIATSAGQFTLSATIGQPVAEASGAAQFDLYAGFWSPLAPPACDPDVNQDGNADQGDIDYLINVIAGGDNPSSIDPDFNHDGNPDQGDVDSLINVVAGGMCP
ncbi:MAG: hypothetical protein WC718_09420 [Phycisphaerales bacterium]|jgi:hypothetical protein